MFAVEKNVLTKSYKTAIGQIPCQICVYIHTYGGVIVQGFPKTGGRLARHIKELVAAVVVDEEKVFLNRDLEKGFLLM